MPLEEYAAKRRFEKTPEPAPAREQHGASRQLLLRAAARRHPPALRFPAGDRRRAEVVGRAQRVRRSIPRVKHLAAHVEDHPIEYGDFEGTIPAGNYGAGSVMLWDRGTFDLLGDASGAEQLARGDLKFRLHGEKLNGDFALVHMKGRGKGNEWLLLKKRDEFATPGWDVEAHAAASSPAARRRRSRRTCRRARASARPPARRTGCGRAAGRPRRRRARPRPQRNRRGQEAKSASIAEKVAGARAAEMPAAHRTDDGYAGRSTRRAATSGCSK